MLLGVQMIETAALEIIVVGVDVVRRRCFDCLPFLRQELDLQLSNDPLPQSRR